MDKYLDRAREIRLDKMRMTTMPILVSVLEKKTG